ncbi:hypothetical protein Tco_1208716, partial [Tanacetum coccineum]
MYYNHVKYGGVRWATAVKLSAEFLLVVFIFPTGRPLPTGNVNFDPDVEHKLCIKYASDEDSASDCDTPVHLYVVVDW